jgi:hypothetical protein
VCCSCDRAAIVLPSCCSPTVISLPSCCDQSCRCRSQADVRSFVGRAVRLASPRRTPGRTPRYVTPRPAELTSIARLRQERWSRLAETQASKSPQRLRAVCNLLLCPFLRARALQCTCARKVQSCACAGTKMYADVTSCLATFLGPGDLGVLGSTLGVVSMSNNRWRSLSASLSAREC